MYVDFCVWIATIWPQKKKKWYEGPGVDPQNQNLKIYITVKQVD